MATKEKISDTLPTFIQDRSDNEKVIDDDPQLSCSKENADGDPKHVCPEGIVYIKIPDFDEENEVDNSSETHAPTDLLCPKKIKTSINYSIKTACDLTLVIQNNSNCVFNIKL